MPTQQLQQTLQQKLQSWWQGRSVWEHRVFVAWAAAVAVLALWFGAFAPLFQRIATLERRVPELETQLNRMRAQPLAGKGAGGVAAAVAPQTGEDLRSTLYGQLAERKISAELRALSPTRVEMRLPEMPMQDALELLDILRRQSGTRVAAFGARSDVASGKAARVVVELERTS